MLIHLIHTTVFTLQKLRQYMENLVPTPTSITTMISGTYSGYSTPYSGCSTPYVTAPSSPPRLNSATFHNPSLRDANFSFSSPSYSSPKRFHDSGDEAVDFAFECFGKFDDSPRSAEELFDHGKIKPLKEMRAETESSETEEGGAGVLVFKTANSSPRSSPRRRRNVSHEAFSASPRKRKDIDLIWNNNEDKYRRRSRKREEAVDNKEDDGVVEIDNHHHHKITKARSLSADCSVSDIFFDDADVHVKGKPKNESENSKMTSFWSSSFSLIKAYRKWRIKDLLFRSASEGRSKDKMQADPASTMSYAILTKVRSRGDEMNFKNNKAASSLSSSSSNFGSDSNGSSSMQGSGWTKSGGVTTFSAHELHYTANRAVSEEMKRKTFLPYKQSLLGCLGFNPGRHEFPGTVRSMGRV